MSTVMRVFACIGLGAVYLILMRIWAWLIDRRFFR